jgi:hypothetical protein
MWSTARLPCLCLFGCWVLFAKSAVAADSPCGYLQVHIDAIADANDVTLPAHHQTFDNSKTPFPIPEGVKTQYGDNPDGWLVTQGYPNNGGAHSWEKLSTNCTVTQKDGAPPTVRLITTTVSDLNSGLKGAGTKAPDASSDFTATWIMSVSLPPTIAWKLTVEGITQSSGTGLSKCTVTPLSYLPVTMPFGSPFSQDFKEHGITEITQTCAQGLNPALQVGPNPTVGTVTVTSDVTLIWSPL